MTTTESKDNKAAVTQASAEQETIQGQSAFHVELSPVGVVVRTVFVGENSQLRSAPAAVFPSLEAAIYQLDELKRLVLGQFGQAAFIGLQTLQQAPQAPQAAQSGAETPEADTQQS